MPSGWIRWLFEQFEFPFTVIYPQTIDAGNLNATFDDIVLADGAVVAAPKAPAIASTRNRNPNKSPPSSAPG